MSIESNDPADVIDAQDARFEIYLRMNNDNEKDYCFSVGINDTFESLLTIFDTLKLSLRPSIFYDQTPKGFQVSTHPGLLTDNGGLLFDLDASKQVVDVKLTDKISDFAWPGQLILPVWKDDNFTFYTFVGILLFWLYTDLPDYYSPTPGICLTNQISIGLAKILRRFDLNDLANDLVKDAVPNSASYAAQLVFFSFHLIKIGFFFLVFYSGLFNPYSLNPYKVHQMNKTEKYDDAKREQLLSIGWTGSKRATVEEYREFYKDYQIQKVGGIVKASRLGLFEAFRQPAIKLGKGEGFDSDISNKSTLKDLIANPEKFVLNYEFFGQIGGAFEQYLEVESTNTNQDIKNFRKYGPITSNDTVKEIIKGRKAASPDYKPVKDSEEKKTE